MEWLRLWHDMPTDPKWRTISKKSGQSICNVIAVFNMIMVCASKSSERGVLENWDSEDVAAALDLQKKDIDDIVSAMQSKVLDGNRLTGWEKRQPKDGTGYERLRKYRSKTEMITDDNASETVCNGDETVCNDVKRFETSEKNRTDTEQNRTEIKKEKKSFFEMNEEILFKDFIKPFGITDLEFTEKRRNLFNLARSNVHIGIEKMKKARDNILASSHFDAQRLKTFDGLFNQWNYQENITLWARGGPPEKQNAAVKRDNFGDGNPFPVDFVFGESQNTG